MYESSVFFFMWIMYAENDWGAAGININKIYTISIFCEWRGQLLFSCLPLVWYSNFYLPLMGFDVMSWQLARGKALLYPLFYSMLGKGGTQVFRSNISNDLSITMEKRFNAWGVYQRILSSHEKRRIILFYSFKHFYTPHLTNDYSPCYFFLCFMTLSPCIRKLQGPSGCAIYILRW